MMADPMVSERRVLMSVPSHEYLIYTPSEGFFESMGWDGMASHSVFIEISR